MDKKSILKQGIMWNRFIRTSKIIFLFWIFIQLINVYQSKQISLFEANDQVEFAKFSDFIINLSDFEDLKLADFFSQHSFISVIANVTLATECIKKSSPCSQPIRIYGKINSAPRPENVFFDKKDDVGKLIDNSVLYGFEYSPCHLNKNDTLYLKVVGIEGKSNFTLTVKYNFMNRNKILCAGGLSLPESRHSAAVFTPLGTIKYGGKINETFIDDQLYLLDGDSIENLLWSILEVDSTLSPPSRYGHYMTFFNNHLIVFGGKTYNDEILNDLWVMNFDKMKWIQIEYASTKNIPLPKYLAGGELMENQGLIVIYGGKDNEDKSVYFLNLKILFELTNYKYFYDESLNLRSEYPEDPKLDYPEKVNRLWKKIEVNDLVPRFGLTITQIGDHELLFFGGFERTNYASSRQEIYNIDANSVKVVQPASATDFPIARGFHKILKYGSILFLYGGRSGLDETLNDMWKFVLSTKKWIKIDDPLKDEINFYMDKSEFIFTKIKENEKPIILGGLNKNQEITNDIILMNLETCLSDRKIFSETACLPCSKGYELSEDKCIACKPGHYLDIDKDIYTQSTCKSCPSGSQNENFNQHGLSGCRICPFGFHNSFVGREKCNPCRAGELCLPASTKPSHNKDILSKVEDDYLVDIDYPQYISNNHDLKNISTNSGFIIVFSITGTMIIILISAYRINKKKMTKFFIIIDFIPLTGGMVKKSSGGLITMLYIILILSLAFSFVSRYIYFNELIEVIPLGNINNSQDPLKLSISMNVELIGRGFSCIDKSDKIDQDSYGCSTDISVFKVNDPNYFIVNNKILSCSQTIDGNCRINFKCEDCKTIENNDVFQITLKNNNSFVQVYNWSFDSVWADNLDYTKGHTILKGIFKPDSNIRSSYVFKGSSPSVMQILLTPIYYNNKKENSYMTGYKANLKSFSRGSIRNEFDFYKEEVGVNFQVQISYAANAYQVNSRKQIEILDFWAFILGMVAGFSFLSRISKFIMEKFHIFDYSWENYVELHEEREKKEDKSDQLEKNSSNAKFIIYKHENNSTELELRNKNSLEISSDRM